MPGQLVCWKCGAGLQGLILPMSRREECAAWGADQHVCRLCQHFAPQRAGQCTEDRAEDVVDKERANFCDYFAPRENAFRGAAGGGAASGDAVARAQLAELFGDEPPPEATDGLSPEDAAKAEFERLFGGGDGTSGPAG